MGGGRHHQRVDGPALGQAVGISQRQLLSLVCRLHGLCRRHDLCVAEWEGTWRNGFCKYLLHPERPVSAYTALVKLEISTFKVMSRNCQSLTIEFIKKSAVLDYRERVIQETVDELLDIQKSRRLGRIVGPESDTSTPEKVSVLANTGTLVWQ